MSAALKWITPDAQSVIVECARVSSDPSKASQPDERLLAYLIRNRHWSPLEMASACIEIATTRDIARQLLRHRSFSFQEFSQRYQNADVLPPVGLREARLQHPTNRQASLPCEDQALADWWVQRQAEMRHEATMAYRAAIERGIAKEVARAVLPEGLTASRLFMAGTIRSWVHFLQVRLDPTAQAEVREVAAAVAGVLRAQMPVIFDAVWGAAVRPAGGQVGHFGCPVSPEGKEAAPDAKNGGVE